ncbi:MAG: AraC family transcriptional regulator [bacterium]
MKLKWQEGPGPWALSTGQRGYERETYEKESQLLPELEIFGWLRFHDTLPGALQADRHPGVYEIHYLRRGHLRWWVEEENYAFNPGCLFIIRPGERHGGEGDAIQPCEHYWLRLGLPSGRKPLPSLTVADTVRLRDGFAALDHRTFPVSPDVNNFFERMLQEHRHRDDPNAALMARLMLHALLIVILRDHDHYRSAALQTPMVTWRVRRAREWLNGQLGVAELDLEALAALLKTSVSALRSRFKTEMGETVQEYWLRRRIDEAKRRLTQTDQDITQIAHELGFSSSQYFSTVFRKQTGLVPGEFRRQRAGT